MLDLDPFLVKYPIFRPKLQLLRAKLKAFKEKSHRDITNPAQRVFWFCTIYLQ